jgi:hypothetical protein
MECHQMIWKDKDGVLKYLFQEFIHFMIAKGTLKLKTLVFLLKRFN